MNLAAGLLAGLQQRAHSHHLSFRQLIPHAPANPKINENCLAEIGFNMKKKK